MELFFIIRRIISGVSLAIIGLREKNHGMFSILVGITAILNVLLSILEVREYIRNKG